MIGEFTLALDDMRRPAVIGLLALSAGLALALLAALVGAIGWLISSIEFVTFRWLETAIDATAIFGLIVLAVLMLPAVAGAVAGLLLDRVVSVVEAANYPTLSPGRSQPLSEAIVQALRFLALMVVVNLLALPLYFVPGLNLVVWFSVNGILLAREYFDQVASRRLDLETARALRRSYRLRLFVAGMAMAGLLLVPIVNLLVPVFGTAFMVHIFHGLKR